MKFGREIRTVKLCVVASKLPTEADRIEALQRVLSGMAADDDVFDIARSVFDLHPKHNTFPGEVFMNLAADALDIAKVTRDNPIQYEGLREVYLPECEFRGRDNRKIQYAFLTSAAVRGGLEPDLLDEVAWWQTDDYWDYALKAAIALIRACAHRQGVTVEQFVEQLAKHYNIELIQPPPS